MEALPLAAGLWVIVPRGEVLDAEFTEQDLQGAAPAAAGVAVKMAPLSVSTEAGVPRWVKAAVKVAMTSGPAMLRRARLAMARREWSSCRLRISAWVPRQVASG